MVHCSSSHEKILDQGKNAYCEVCEKERMFRVVYRYTVQNINAIFSWVSLESYYFLCEACSQGIQLKNHEVEAVYGKPKLPFLIRYGAVASGLTLLVIFIIFFIVKIGFNH